MHLLPCNPPRGTLEPAPRTSLRADSTRERWEGFWQVEDECYYTRCLRDDGSEQWYRFADDESRQTLILPRPRETRVLTLRPRHQRQAFRQMLLFTVGGVSGRGRRSMLVGASRRQPRPGPGARGDR